MSSPNVQLTFMSPKQAHQEICDKHGEITVNTAITDQSGKTKVVESTSRLWGGEGHFVIDLVGDRDFGTVREQVNALGKKYGCHTCGRYAGWDAPPNTRSNAKRECCLNWIPDHQPPLGIIENADRWQLYAQCLECSDLQMGKSIVYKNAFKKRVGRFPDKVDQDLFWGEGGRPRRLGVDYDKKYFKGKEDKMEED